jgi:hypothetical protein
MLRPREADVGVERQPNLKLHIIPNATHGGERGALLSTHFVSGVRRLIAGVAAGRPPPSITPSVDGRRLALPDLLDGARVLLERGRAATGLPRRLSW